MEVGFRLIRQPNSPPDHRSGRRRGVTVRVHNSNADMRYLVLPMRPEGTEGWDAERLAGIVTRDCMVGTALPQA